MEENAALPKLREQEIKQWKRKMGCHVVGALENWQDREREQKVKDMKRGCTDRCKKVLKTGEATGL